jgi:uncharacterized protein YnzC (UPF0291/DUF896 family)
MKKEKIHLSFFTKLLFISVYFLTQYCAPTLKLPTKLAAGIESVIKIATDPSTSITPQSIKKILISIHPNGATSYANQMYPKTDYPNLTQAEYESQILSPMTQELEKLLIGLTQPLNELKSPDLTQDEISEQTTILRELLTTNKLNLDRSLSNLIQQKVVDTIYEQINTLHEQLKSEFSTSEFKTPENFPETTLNDLLNNVDTAIELTPVDLGNDKTLTNLKKMKANLEPIQEAFNNFKQAYADLQTAKENPTLLDSIKTFLNEKFNFNFTTTAGIAETTATTARSIATQKMLELHFSSLPTETQTTIENNADGFKQALANAQQAKIDVKLVYNEDGTVFIQKGDEYYNEAGRAADQPDPSDLKELPENKYPEGFEGV